MKFSNKWIKGFLTRGCVTRRKITREDKEVPTDEEIASVLNIGQQKYVENGHTAKTCYNFDETAFTWSIGPVIVSGPGSRSYRVPTLPDPTGYYYCTLQLGCSIVVAIYSVHVEVN